MKIFKPSPRIPSLFSSRSGDLFDSFFRQLSDLPLSPALFAEPIGWTPAVELVDTGDAFVLTAEVPGIDRDDLEVDVQDDLLTIRGTKKDEFEKQDRRYQIYERSYGSFERSFSLPRSVDLDKISAEFENGVLKIRLPKTEVARGRKIEIKKAR